MFNLCLEILSEKGEKHLNIISALGHTKAVKSYGQ